MDRGSLFAVRRGLALFDRFVDYFLGNAWPSYALVAVLQLKVLWGIWSVRDLTTGDTSAYFTIAVRWANDFTVHILFSPLYTSFYGTILMLTNDAYAATTLHRIIIVMAASLGVLAIMRKILPPTLALLVAVWWAVLPINFETLSEIHLFTLLPILGAWLIAASGDSSWHRGFALAILLAATVLVRNEIVIGFMLYGLICLVRELGELKQGRSNPKIIRDRLAGYAVPVTLAALLCGLFYWRSAMQFSELAGNLEAKHTVNVCQAYAFGYQQRHPEWPLNPWFDCEGLMEAIFGQRLPTLMQMIKANPYAVWEHFTWNISLAINGLQVSLFNAMSGTVNPDYPSVNQNWLVLIPTAAVLLAVAWGAVLAVRRWDYWWPQWFRERRGAWLILLSVLFVAGPIIVTQRPRPSYLFPTTVVLMAVIGSAIHVLTKSRPVIMKRVSLAAALIVLVTVPSYYTNKPRHRPLYASYERLHPLAPSLRQDGNRILLGDDAGALWGYLDLGSVEVFDYSLLEYRSAEQSLPQLLDERGINILYAQPGVIDKLRNLPKGSQLLDRPDAFGWRRIAPAKTSDESWFLFYREQQERPAYELQGRLADGWMMRTASLQINRPEPEKTLRMQIEVPSWLPLKFPLNIEARLEGQELQALKVTQPGQYELAIPLDQPGRVELSADQWLVPAKLGIGSSDQRELSYRVLAVEQNAQPAYELQGRLADGWVMRTASLQINRPEPEKTLRMQIEVPSWLPLKFPLNIEARLEGQELQALKVTQPGQYELAIPLDQPGRVELSADQWLVPAKLGIGSSDQRELSYRVLAVEQNAQPAYELQGRLADGWMMRTASLQINRPEPEKTLRMQIEVPSWLPLKFPLNIEARLEGQELQALKVTQPGQYELAIPLDQPGRVELSADQWLVPAKLGIGSSDQRELSYRVLAVEQNAQPAYELQGRLADGWVMRTASLQINRPEPEKTLRMQIEVPSWLPLKFPLNIEARLEGQELQALKVTQPGQYELAIPLDQPGRVELSADQWLVPAKLGIGSSDQRELSYRVLAVEQNAQPAYELQGRLADGWMMRTASLQINRPEPEKTLRMQIEVPSWLPLKFPLNIEARLEGQELQALKVTQPGQYELAIPLDQPGRVELSADQWLVPAKLGIGSSDQRELSYRVLAVEQNAQPAYELQGRLADGWMMRTASLQINRPEPEKTLRMQIEVPSWLPLKFPLNIEARLEGQELQALKVTQPGQYELAIPLDQPGRVELSADQWLVPAKLGIGSSDQRELSYRVLAVEQNAQPAYELQGRLADGWMMRTASLQINRPEPEKTLRMQIEVPSWLPLKFPLNIEARLEGQELQALKVTQPGQYELAIPLDQPGRVELSADQWLVPAKLGIGSSDQRELSYRVLAVEQNAQPAYELQGRLADGWVMRTASLQINRPEPEKTLRMQIEVPSWLPLKFPLNIEARLEGQELQALKVTQPGQYELAIPLDQPGRVELSADQWLVPAKLGIGSSDQRELSYRVLEVSTGEATQPRPNH